VSSTFRFAPASTRASARSPTRRLRKSPSSIGARVASIAEANEVLVSQTVRDLVAGSGITFDDRGAHALKGIPGEWRLYAVANR